MCLALVKRAIQNGIRELFSPRMLVRPALRGVGARRVRPLPPLDPLFPHGLAPPARKLILRGGEGGFNGPLRRFSALRSAQLAPSAPPAVVPVRPPRKVASLTGRLRRGTGVTGLRGYGATGATGGPGHKCARAPPGLPGLPSCGAVGATASLGVVPHCIAAAAPIAALRP